ncbi:MAG TPA: hypothetical protein VJT75_12700 [Thermoleophilaceae bacterium]|nr:hypothetical protein [Thermoleophilaceae bacterium]
MRTPLIGALLALAVAAVVTTGALAGSESTTLYTASAPKNQWATINICDTEKHPDQLGIRARMPALDRGVKMKMRFFVEYMKNGAWTGVPSTDGGTTMSDWFVAGTGQHKWEELGDTFRLSRLQPGDSYLMRGLVKYQWRKHGKVVKRAHAYTTAKHSRGEFGDPKGYSAATCTVSGST